MECKDRGDTKKIIGTRRQGYSCDMEWGEK